MREQYAIKCSIFTIYNFSASSSTRFGLECVQLVNHWVAKVSSDDLQLLVIIIMVVVIFIEIHIAKQLIE